MMAMRYDDAGLDFAELAVATPQSKHQASANETPGSCNTKHNGQSMCFSEQHPRAYGGSDETRHAAKQRSCASQDTSPTTREL